MTDSIKPQPTLADVQLAIERAITNLRDDVTSKIHGVDVRVESLTTTTEVWRATHQRHLSDLENKLGGNSAAIASTMDALQRSTEKTREAENEIRNEIDELEKKVIASRAYTEGVEAGIDGFRKSLTWGVGILAALLGLLATLGTIIITQSGILP